MEHIGRVFSDLYSRYYLKEPESLSEQSSQLMERVVAQSKHYVAHAVSSGGEMVASGLEYYDYLMSIGDKRVEGWGLMWSPLPTLTITALYLIMCLRGPRLMAPYPALSLRPLVVIYNLLCAALNLYIFLEILLTSRQIQYSWTCQPVDYSWDPASVRIARALWWYYISKLVELCDSLFIILRKKDKQQLSFLHIYHHATMFSLWWIGARYVAGGSSFLGAMFNCAVHVLMYSYYALAAIGGRIRKYLWWKKYLTVLQMLQFIAALVMGINAIRIGCDFPMWMQYTACVYMMSFLLLFSDFYYKAYLANKHKSLEQSSAVNGSNHRSNGVQRPSNGNTNGVITNGNGAVSSHSSQGHNGLDTKKSK